VNEVLRPIQIVAIVLLIAFFNSCLKRIENGTPDIKDRIIDRVDMLSKSEEDSLFNLIRELDVEYGPQIAVLIVDSLNREDIQDLAWKTADKIKLGRRTFADGIIICVSVRDQLVRITIDKGLVKIVPDDSAKFINNDIMIPEFKNANYFLGLYSGISYLKKLIEDRPELIGKM